MLFDKFILKELHLQKIPFTKKTILCSKYRNINTQNGVKVYIILCRGVKVLFFYLDRKIKMGTIGVCEGETIALAFEYATRKKLPVISVVASGGMRIHEGTMALMQMAKMTLAVKKHSKQGLLYIAVVTNPTLGGASASFVSLADIIIAEDDAIYGFSGPRIISETTRENLPEDFQSASFAKRHGQVDIVVARKAVETTLLALLQLHKKK